MVLSIADERDPEARAAGYRADGMTLRAPDIAIGTVPEQDGWIAGAPLLAVEYAGRGQDEAELQAKIKDLLAAGTRYIWVVRLLEPRRVEVYGKEQPPRTHGADDILQAPGILHNPVAVRALYDRDTAHEAVLRNLLQRRGYESLEAVQRESEVRGEARALLTVLDARGIALSDAQRQTILDCRDGERLQAWLRKAPHAASAGVLFD